MDFDKVIKMVAVNKVIANLDSFTDMNLRNYYLYEKEGKLDIIPFDFDISMTAETNMNYWNENINEYDLSKRNIKVYSRIAEIIIQNEEYTKRYYNYVKETQQTLNDMKIDEKVDEIYKEVKEIVNNNEKKVFSYIKFEENINKLRKFLNDRKITSSNIQ